MALHKHLKNAYAVTALVGTLPLIFLIMLPTILYWPFSLRRRMSLCGWHWQLMSWIILKVIFLSPTKIIDRRKPPHRRRLPHGLIICNHQSMLDIPLYILRYHVSPIMKREVLYFPIIGAFGIVAGAIPLDRRSKESRKQVMDTCKERLQTGVPVQYYPEGTRKAEGGLPREFSRIKTPLMSIAYRENLPITPVAGWGTAGVLDFKRGIKLGCKMRLLIDHPVFPDDYPDEESFLRAAWEKVRTNYQELDQY